MLDIIGTDIQLSTRCYVEYMQRLLHEYCTDGLGLNRMAAPHKDGHVGVFAGESEKVRPLTRLILTVRLPVSVFIYDIASHLTVSPSTLPLNPFRGLTSSLRVDWRI